MCAICSYQVNGADKRLCCDDCWMPTPVSDEDVKRYRKCEIVLTNKADSKIQALKPYRETLCSSASSTAASLSVMSSSMLTKVIPMALAVKQALKHSMHQTIHRTNQSAPTPTLPNVTTLVISKPIPPKKPVRPPLLLSTAGNVPSEFLSKSSSTSNSTLTSTTTSSSNLTCSASSLSTYYSGSTSSFSNQSFHVQSTSTSTSSFSSVVREELQSNSDSQGFATDTAIVSSSTHHSNQRCEASSLGVPNRNDTCQSTLISPALIQSSSCNTSSLSITHQTSRVQNAASDSCLPVSAPPRPLKPPRNGSHTGTQVEKSLSPFPSPTPPWPSLSPPLLCSSSPADSVHSSCFKAPQFTPSPLTGHKAITATSTSTSTGSSTVTSSTKSCKQFSEITVMKEANTTDIFALSSSTTSAEDWNDRRFLKESFPERQSTYALSMNVSSYTNNPTPILNILGWQLMVLPPKILMPSIVASRITQYTKSIPAAIPVPAPVRVYSSAPAPALIQVPVAQPGHRFTGSSTLDGTRPAPSLPAGPDAPVKKGTKAGHERPPTLSSQYKSEVKPPSASALECAAVDLNTQLSLKVTHKSKQLTTSIRVESDDCMDSMTGESTYRMDCVDKQESCTSVITSKKGKLFPNSCTTYQNKKNASRLTSNSTPIADDLTLAGCKPLHSIYPSLSSSAHNVDHTKHSYVPGSMPVSVPKPLPPPSSSTSSSSSSSTPSSSSPASAPISPCPSSSSSAHTVDHTKHSYVPGSAPVSVPKPLPPTSTSTSSTPVPVPVSSCPSSSSSSSTHTVDHTKHSYATGSAPVSVPKPLPPPSTSTSTFSSPVPVPAPVPVPPCPSSSSSSSSSSHNVDHTKHSYVPRSAPVSVPKPLPPPSSSTSTSSSSSTSTSLSPAPVPVPVPPCPSTSSLSSSSALTVDHTKHSYVPSTGKTAETYIPKNALTPVPESKNHPHTPPPPLDRNLELFIAKKDLVAPPKITSNRGVLKVPNFTSDQAVAKYDITIASAGDSDIQN